MEAPRVAQLVLDAGPLLSLAPLRGLSQEYFTVPQVLGELKDEKSRAHFHNLGLSSGVKVETRVPDATALSKVTLAAKKSGDFAVLSAADLHVIALTYALNEEYAAKKAALSKESPIVVPQDSNEQEKALKDAEKVADTPGSDLPVPPMPDEETPEDLEALSQEFERLPLDDSVVGSEKIDPAPKTSIEEDAGWVYEDPSDSDDGQGDWITPGNVALHKSRALDLLPDAAAKLQSKKQKAQPEKVDVGCMTADYAMQNVLLHMGLNLVGVEGTRISSVKSWVLRCHACFKICKDSSKKFCPSCGNPSLLRTTISTTAPTTPGGKPTVQIHLKSNFQYRTRGTKYAIPMPKPGSAKKGSGTGIILREDQQEYMKAVEKNSRQEERDRERLMKAAVLADAEGGKGAGSVKVGNWDDPDWMPEMLAGGRKRESQGLPTIGMGRKNPNERRRKR